MTTLEALLERVAADLERAKASWAMVGAIAVGVRCEPRFTKDIDVAVAVSTDEEAEALVFSLRSAGYDVMATVEQEETGRLATARLLPSRDPEGRILDLLFASSGIEPEIVGEADRIEVFADTYADVARTGHLVALKLLSRSEYRLRDQDDLLRLLAVAPPDEIERAREAVRLITERGFDRGRDLASDLEDLLEHRPWDGTGHII